MSALTLYTVYGLTVASEIPLAGLAEGRGEPDVVVQRGEVQAQADRTVQAGCFQADAERIFLYQPKAGLLLAEHGHTLTVEVPPDHDAHFMTSVVLGRGLAAILHQRGVLTLHASAVVHEGRGLAFVGERGQGKSTTTAAFLRHGARLITDDLLPVRLDENGHPLVFSGGSRLKLWPASLDLTDDSEQHTRVADHVEKRYWSAGDAVETEAVRLDTVYELTFGEDFALVPYVGRSAFAALYRHTFTGALALATEQGPDYLNRVAEIANRLSVVQFVRPRDLHRLDDLVGFVSKHGSYTQGGSPETNP